LSTWRKFLPAFSLRTLLELLFFCGLLFYIWFIRPPGNVIQPDHLLQIDVAGTLIDSPIQGLFLVDPDGYVNLGATYGKLKVSGMTGNEAQAALLVHLQKVLAAPQATVSIAGWRKPGDFDRIEQLERQIKDLRTEFRGALKKANAAQTSP
jgi:hypothetical protein